MLPEKAFWLQFCKYQRWTKELFSCKNSCSQKHCKNFVNVSQIHQRKLFSPLIGICNYFPTSIYSTFYFSCEKSKKKKKTSKNSFCFVKSTIHSHSYIRVAAAAAAFEECVRAFYGHGTRLDEAQSARDCWKEPPTSLWGFILNPIAHPNRARKG